MFCIGKAQSLGERCPNSGNPPPERPSSSLSFPARDAEGCDMTPASVELCSVPAYFGQGANDGAYYPVGLLTIATHLRRSLPCTTVHVIDVHHDPVHRPRSD